APPPRARRPEGPRQPGRGRRQPLPPRSRSARRRLGASVTITDGRTCMHWSDALQQLHASEQVPGAEWLRRFAAQSHNSPNLPPQAYDGDDIMPIVRRLTDEEIEQFGVEPRLSSVRAMSV